MGPWQLLIRPASDDWQSSYMYADFRYFVKQCFFFFLYILLTLKNKTLILKLQLIITGFTKKVTALQHIFTILKKL